MLIKDYSWNKKVKKMLKLAAVAICACKNKKLKICVILDGSAEINIKRFTWTTIVCFSSNKPAIYLALLWLAISSLIESKPNSSLQIEAIQRGFYNM